MNNSRLLYHMLVLVLFFGLWSCATPIAPTGGPQDRQGPVVENMIPESGTVSFDGRTFEFYFDEFVNRNNARNAITVEPDLGIPYEVSWKRKMMSIEFEDDFPDSTTVIIKLGTEITDTRNNKMSSPITLAVSTGDEIDSGEIRGKIKLAESGEPATDKKVLLYRQPFDLSQRATYQAQTDTGGTFNFTYLAEGNYRALVVDDRNRNKIWDRENETAYPFYDEIIMLEKSASDTLDVVYTAQPDTIKPVLQGVGLFSQNRMRLRFSENISTTNEASFSITDSLENNYTSAYPLYISEEDPFVLFAQSEEPLLEDITYNIDPEGVTDIAGNTLDSGFVEFTGTAQEDTTKQRIIGRDLETDLLLNDPITIVYAAPITDPEIVDSLVVIEGDIDFDDWPEVRNVNNRLIISPQGEWIEGVDYQFLAWNPITMRRQLFEPNIWDSTEYGDIDIRILDADSTHTHLVSLEDPSGRVVRSLNFGEQITITDLPPVRYTLKLFRDENGDQQWNMGNVVPYRSPEKYYVQQNINVQVGFTSEVQITFN
ncbi:MAG: Ig-like domain-containing protein [Gracilimonas sp.]|nr:Ig-like domain-containing protein [Gracilimonas sp.]